MSATPPTSEAPGTGPDQGTDPVAGDPPPAYGPRVSRDDMKDLGRMRRSAVDRKLAGVAGGVARHFDIDPLVVRILFVVLVLFGGGGLLLYGACWLFVPDERTGEATISIDDRSRGVVLVIAGVLAGASVVGDTVGGWGFPWPLAVAGLVAVAMLASKNVGQRPHPGPPVGSPAPAADMPPGPGGPHAGPTYTGYRPGPPPPAPASPPRRGPILFWFTMALAAVLAGVVGLVDLAGVDVPFSAYPATVLATCGAMLLVGSVFGRPGGIIFIGLVAALATAVTSVGEDLDLGEVEQRPATAAALDDGYALDLGEIRVDLTGIEDLGALDGRTLELDAYAGRIEVIVPDDGLDVAADARIEGGGEAKLFGDTVSGSDSGSHDGGARAPLLTIDTELVFGQIEIRTEEAA